MEYASFVTLLHELLARDLSIASVMSELTSAQESAHPELDWQPVKRIDFDESSDLLKRWLAPCLKREPPRAKRIKAIWCGLFNPIRGEEAVADMYVSGTKDFERNEVPCKWNVHPAYWPLQRYANSRVLADIHRCAYGKLSKDAENYLCIGYAAKTIAMLLGRVDADLVLGTRKEVQVAVGWDSGQPEYIGRFGRGGFVARPAAEALAGMQGESARYAQYLREAERRELEAIRYFRHPDGRRWSIAVAEGWIELQFTDTDGDQHRRKQWRERTDEHMPSIAGVLIKEQILEGFVEVDGWASGPIQGT